MIDNTKEYILCAAVKRRKRSGSNDIYDVEIGYRHGDIFQRFKPKHIWFIRLLGKFRLYGAAAWLFTKASPLEIDGNQGFLTSHNRFVDRREAMRIAVECGQVENNTNKQLLFSEDLY